MIRSGLREEVLSGCHRFMSPCLSRLWWPLAVVNFCRRCALSIERPGSLPGAHFNGVFATLLQASEHSSQSLLPMIRIYYEFIKLTVTSPVLKTTAMRSARKPVHTERWSQRTNLMGGFTRIARGVPWAGSITGGEACGYPCSEKEGFTHPVLWRAPCFWGTHEWELHAVDT